MKRLKLEIAETQILVQYFREVALAQDLAEIDCDWARVNRLYDNRIEIAAELRSRSGDHRRQLMILYEDLNLRVRLNAAIATLAVAPAEARRVLQQLHDWKLTPYCGDAGDILKGLDNGTFVPT